MVAKARVNFVDVTFEMKYYGPEQMFDKIRYNNQRVNIIPLEER